MSKWNAISLRPLGGVLNPARIEVEKGIIGSNRWYPNKSPWYDVWAGTRIIIEQSAIFRDTKTIIMEQL